MEDLLITKTGAAFLLGCSGDTVLRLEREGLLPSERTPRGWRVFRVSDVARTRALLADRPSRWAPYPTAA